MPGMDRTGPLGQGPLTGRGMGPCGAGFRRGFGKGMGRGFRRFDFAQPVFQETQQVVLTEDEEKKILKTDLEDLKIEMKEIEKRLKELKE